MAGALAASAVVLVVTSLVTPLSALGLVAVVVLAARRLRSAAGHARHLLWWAIAVAGIWLVVGVIAALAYVAMQA